VSLLTIQTSTVASDQEKPLLRTHSPHIAPSRCHRSRQYEDLNEANEQNYKSNKSLGDLPYSSEDPYLDNACCGPLAYVRIETGTTSRGIPQRINNVVMILMNEARY